MPMSNSILAYEDIQKIFDQALESEIGLSITFDTRGAVINFRQRCYKFRGLTHRASELAFEEGDARYGTSIYDTLAITIKIKIPGQPWVIELRKREKTKFDVRELKA